MFLKKTFRFLCAVAALTSAPAFADTAFHVEILRVVNGVEQPMSLVVSAGQPGSISLQSTDDASRFSVDVTVDALADDDVFSVIAVATEINAAGAKNTSEIRSRVKLETLNEPVVAGVSNVHSQAGDSQLTFKVAKVDTSALPSQAQAH